MLNRRGEVARELDKGEVMTAMRLRYVQAWVDDDGRAHRYFRRPGFKRSSLPGMVGSDEFQRAYQEAMRATEPVGAKRVKPGSINAAVAAFLDSELHFRSRAKGTQDMRRPILERFREKTGEMPIASMTAAYISAVIGKMKPHAARNWLKTLRAFCVFCVAEKMMKSDVTRDIKLPKGGKKSEGHHTWTEGEVAQFEAKHPVGSKARLALALGMYTLQRRSDVVKMGRQQIETGVVIKAGGFVIDQWMRGNRQGKTGTAYDLPIFPDLKTILKATPSGHLTFLVTKTGRPYAACDFSEQFRAWCDEAGLPQRCVFHGLRKFGCVWFAERGCGAPEIASWSGHMSLKEVERYIRAANQKKLAASAMVKVLEAQEKNGSGSEVSNPSGV